MDFALNHMVAPHLHWADLLTLSADLGCIGVEFRNDLPTPLFSGDPPETVAQVARDKGLRIVGLSQVYPFNAWSDDIKTEVAALIDTAAACGAETINLIPRNDGTDTDLPIRTANLRTALSEIRPMLADTGLVALIEPLGFARASLRHKAEALDAIDAVGGPAEFKLVHDTFHHTLANETEVFANRTGIVHVSGVTDPALGISEMEDAHRVLVDDTDRIENIPQLQALTASGYQGPVSFEPFAPEVHALADPAPALAASMAYIRSALTTL